jgi:prepilin-type N-terminal cleavage/methylation domain-containing protein
MISKGFTLLEMLLSVVIASLLLSVMFGWMKVTDAAQERSYRDSIRLDNQNIARALRSYAAAENNGFLPAPYTGGNYKSAPVDVGNATLLEYLAQGEIASSRYNQDDSASENVKHYQLITPKPTYCMPIVGSSSECVTLSYDRAVIYQTTCALADACNDGTPGASAPYAMSGWQPTYPDLSPVEISTLDIQQSFWRDTWIRLNDVRWKIRTGFNATVAAAAAGDTTNHFFKPNLAGSPNLIGADPATNQGCRDGWYQLNSIDVNVLSYYGLDPQSVYAVTAWGGRIDYCQDYDPTNAGANVLPHVAALRINKSVTAGSAPSATITQNLILLI